MFDDGKKLRDEGEERMTKKYDAAGTVIKVREPSNEEAMQEAIVGSMERLKDSIDKLIAALERAQAHPPTKKMSTCCDGLVIRKVPSLMTYCDVCKAMCKVKEILL